MYDQSWKEELDYDDYGLMSSWSLVSGDIGISQIIKHCN